MSPVIVHPTGIKAKMHVCSVSRAGIGLGHGVVGRAKWKINSTIQVGFIEKAKCILLRSVADSDGFRLAYSDTRRKTGGKIQCKAFLRNYIQTLVELPKRALTPVFLPDSEWTLALMLEPLQWIEEEFTKAGANRVPQGTIGVYELLAKAGAVLRVGQGQIKDRIDAHLKDPRFVRPTVDSFQYAPLEGSEDAQIVEKILIAVYETETGVLPRFQEVRA